MAMLSPDMGAPDVRFLWLVQKSYSRIARDRSRRVFNKLVVASYSVKSRTLFLLLDTQCAPQKIRTGASPVHGLSPTIGASA